MGDGGIGTVGTEEGDVAVDAERVFQVEEGEDATVEITQAQKGEVRILFPTFRDQLLPLLLDNRKELPKPLQEFLDCLEKSPELFNADPEIPDEIKVAEHNQLQILAAFLEDLEPVLNKLPENMRLVLAVMIDVRIKLREHIALISRPPKVLLKRRLILPPRRYL